MAKGLKNREPATVNPEQYTLFVGRNKKKEKEK